MGATSQKFPAKGPHTHEQNQVWRRPIISNSIDLEQVGQILHDIHFTATLSDDSRETSVRAYKTACANEVKVYKYKKVEDRVRPVPAIMPDTGCIKEFSVVENYIEDVMETTNPLGKFYTLKRVKKVKIFQK